MFKFILAAALCLTAPALFATSALQTCEALLTAGMQSSRNANMLMSLREVQAILAKHAGRASAISVMDTFYGQQLDLIPPQAAALKEKLQKIEPALIEPNDAEQVVFARILHGEKAIRASLLRLDTATQNLDLAYNEVRTQLRPKWQTPLYVSGLGALNIGLASLLVHGHASLWLSLPILGATLMGDVRAFQDFNYTSTVSSQVAYARVRRTLQKILENDPTQLAIQTDRLHLPPEAGIWLAREEKFAPDERREAYRFNSTGMNRGLQTVPELQDFRIEHIAYFDTYTNEPTWMILVHGPRPARASTTYKVH